MTFKLDLLVCVSERTLSSWSAMDIARLSHSINLDVAKCQAKISVHFFLNHAEFIEALGNAPRPKDRSATIVVSDYFTEKKNDRYVVSDFAIKIEDLFRSRSRCCGLIALTDHEIPEHSVIDAAIDCKPWSIDVLSAKLAEVSNRLWLKTPPEKRNKMRAVSVVRVSSLPQLRECLKLRAAIYAKLGYLPAEVCSASTQVEMDGYDPVAIHLVALDLDHGDKIVGAARLIVPGIPAITMDDIYRLMMTYPQWFDQIASEEETPIWRKCLENPSPNSLPIFDSFQYFETLTNQHLFFKDDITPSECCELSRIVVHPAYRGLGISRLLVTKAIEEAGALRRQYLLLECAPHHETMYANYGFETIQDEKTKYYARAQRLDTYAVAMRLVLDAEYDTLGVAPKATMKSGRYGFFVDDGPASGCTLSIDSSSLDSVELAKLFDQPITALPGGPALGGALRDPGQGLVSRSNSASLRGILLAALKGGLVHDFLQVSKLVVNHIDVTSIQLTNPKGRTFALTKQQLDYKPTITLENLLGSWLVTAHE